MHSLPDPLPLRLGLCHWPGQDVPVLLPEAQDQGLDRLLRGHHCRADRLPADRNDRRVLWILLALLRLLPRGHQLPAEGAGAGLVPQHARREQGGGQVGRGFEQDEGMRISRRRIGEFVI